MWASQGWRKENSAQGRFRKEKCSRAMAAGPPMERGNHRLTPKRAGTEAGACRFPRRPGLPTEPVSWPKPSDGADSRKESLHSPQVALGELEVIGGSPTPVAAAWPDLLAGGCAPFRRSKKKCQLYQEQSHSRFARAGGQLPEGRIRTEIPRGISPRLPGQARTTRHKQTVLGEAG